MTHICYRRYFHGGVPSLAVGSFLLPPDQTGHSAAGREDRVYITSDILQALCCALIENGMVYRVCPVGRLRPDDNGRYGGPHYAVRKALILARAAVPPALRAFRYDDFHAFHRDVVDLEFALDEQIEREVQSLIKAGAA